MPSLTQALYSLLHFSYRPRSSNGHAPKLFSNHKPFALAHVASPSCACLPDLTLAGVVHFTFPSNADRLHPFCCDELYSLHLSAAIQPLLRQGDPFVFFAPSLPLFSSRHALSPPSLRATPSICLVDPIWHLALASDGAHLLTIYSGNSNWRQIVAELQDVRLG